MIAIPPRKLRARPAPVVVAGSWFALVLLTLTLLVSYIDRFVLAILVQPIEADLHLSDTQMGSISGISFAGAYGIFVLPTARWAGPFLKSTPPQRFPRRAQSAPRYHATAATAAPQS